MRINIYKNIAIPHTINFLFKVMRIQFIIILLFQTVCMAGTLKGQTMNNTRISLNAHDISLKAAFSAIEQETEFSLGYNAKDINTNQMVDISAVDEPVFVILKKLLKGYKGEISQVSDRNIFLKVKRSEPSETPVVQEDVEVVKVTGRVTDDTGLPLPGVSIFEKGGKSSTATDNNGNYSISVPDHAMLIFRFIGYTAQDQIVAMKEGNAVTMDIIMKAANNGLKEVVVVGYGTQKKVDLTGAISTVSGDVLADRPTPNVARGLEGVVPNLNIVLTDGKPIRSPTFNIRGTTSIGGGGSALVLIDGVPGDPSLLNPNDIDNISVLKDAASSAIYGARGAYGVVLINTKNPKKEKTTVNFNASYTINQKTVDPSVVSNGYEWTQNFVNSYTAWYDYRSQPTTINGVLPYTPAYLDSLKARVTNPSLPQVTVDPATGKYVYYGNTDWYKQLYRQSMPATDYSLNIASSTKNSSFYISGRDYNQKGIYTYNPDDFSRYNLRMKGTVNITPWLTLSDNLDFNAYKYFYPLTNGNAPVTRYLDITAAPVGILRNPDGSLTPSSYYSVGDLATGNDHSNTNQMYIRNTVSLNADLIKNYLNLKADFSYAHTNYNVLSQFYPVSYSAGPGLTGQSVNNYLNNSSTITNYWATNIYAEGKKSFGKHSFKLLAGTNIEDNTINMNSYQRDGLIDPSLPDFNLLNGTNYTITGGGNEWTIAGFFGRLNYDYDEKYLLEINGRYDGSSKFPSYSQFGFFPSVSAGWIMSKEKFMSFASNWLDMFKFRASFGSLGNGNINPYQFIPQMAVAQSTTTAINGAYPTYTRNPNVLPDNLTWETSTTIDGGVDFAMFNNRFSGSFDYYSRATTGMFTPSQPLPATFGAAVPNGNYSNLRTNGWDLSLNWSDHISKSVRYSVGIVLSNYTATITKYNNPNGVLPYGGVNTYYKGEKVGDIWGFTTQGLYTAEQLAGPHPNQTNYIVVSNSNIPLPGDVMFKDINGDGAINIGKGTLADHGDLSVIGNSTPKLPYGVNLGLSVKNFSFSAFIQGVGHLDWWPGTDAGLFWGQYNRPYGSIPTSMLANVWSPSNPDAYFPRYRGYVALSGTRELAVVQTRYLQNAAYTRLKNVNLTYTLPQSLASRLKMSSAKIFFTGQNLLTFTPLHKYAPNYDPEVIYGSDPEVNPAANIGNGYSYPMLKSYTLGINLTF
ncbi:SusC/RagA family TonB-linked outer membrane protein [Mucilaginibacter sp. McL0603]|uniref:SusC/RagA family TonB-linked outer membrane protein n=1 Tax=Mucilaginibacter sp. McL0603 TaxID=3415670 RepID=UPI003CFAEE75